jgi:hypothetical protein
MSFGTAVHLALLEPARFALECVAAPRLDRRTKSGKEIYEAFASESVGKLILSADQFEAVKTIQAKVLSNPLASMLLSGGKAEHSLFWVDAVTGVKCRARVDYAHLSPPSTAILDPATGETVVSSYALIDIKTTDKGILPEEFSRTLYNYRYYQQAGAYTSGASAVLGTWVTEFLFIAIESSPPYEHAIYRLDFGSLEKGLEEWRAGLRVYREAVEKNEWAGPAKGVQTIALPGWAFAKLG